MKVECEKQKFTPVTITLESEAELMFIAKLIGGSSNQVAEEFGVDGGTHSRIYNTLEAMVGVDQYRGAKDVIVNLSKH